MQGFGKRLRERAAALGLSDSEVARRLEMSQARYHNYVADVAEPNLGSVVKICRVLSTTPDVLLGFEAAQPLEGMGLLRSRLLAAGNALQGEALAYTVEMAQAMVAAQQRLSSKSKPRRRPIADT